MIYRYAGIILGILFGALVNTTMTLSVRRSYTPLSFCHGVILTAAKWAILHILKDPELRDAIQQEIETSGLASSFEGGSTACEVEESVAAVQQLPLLDSIVKEVLRFYSGSSLFISLCIYAVYFIAHDRFTINFSQFQKVSLSFDIRCDRRRSTDTSSRRKHSSSSRPG